MILQHPLTWLEINSDALEHNAAAFKKIIKNRLLAPVIKSNGYGHGMIETAQIFNTCKDVDWLCVSLLSEAITIRKAGITKPLLVLSAIDADPILAVEHAIDLIVYDFNHAKLLNNHIGSTHGTLSIHIKVDTGLSRFGIAHTNAINDILRIAELPHIKINGIFSHFAESQKPDTSFTCTQINLFNEIINEPSILALNIPYKHLANSAAAIVYDLPECNLFRIGLGMYGIWPSSYIESIAHQRFGTISLQQALTWKAQITQIKTVPAHSFVGYNREFCTTKETRIATIPVGYFDGYDLRFSNKSHIIIHGSAAPIIGRVCMNVIMADITDIPHTQVGDEVLLLADYPGIRISDLTELTAQDNRREIMSTLHPSLPRFVVTPSAQPSIQYPKKALEPEI